MHGTRKLIARTPRTDPQLRIQADLRDLAPLRLQRAEGPEQTGLFNACVNRHHYLGYRQLLGSHLRCFLLDRHYHKALAVRRG